MMIHNLSKKRREAGDLRDLAGIMPEPFATQALAMAAELELAVAHELERMRLFVAIESYRNDGSWSPGMPQSEKDVCKPYALDTGLTSIDAAGNALGAISPHRSGPGGTL